MTPELMWKLKLQLQKKKLAMLCQHYHQESEQERERERDERSTSALLCLRLPMSVNEVTYQGRYAVNVGPVQPCTPSTLTQTVT